MENKKQLNPLAIRDYLNKLWYIYTIEYYEIFEECLVTWDKVKDVLLNEIWLQVCKIIVYMHWKNSGKVTVSVRSRIICSYLWEVGL